MSASHPFHFGPMTLCCAARGPVAGCRQAPASGAAPRGSGVAIGIAVSQTRAKESAASLQEPASRVDVAKGQRPAKGKGKNKEKKRISRLNDLPENWWTPVNNDPGG